MIHFSRAMSIDLFTTSCEEIQLYIQMSKKSQLKQQWLAYN